MAKPTVTLLDAKARKAVLDGVNAIYEPVARTFGPQGKNALLFRTWNRGSRITNDGYTVSECQEPKNVAVKLAADAFKEATKRTNERCGDGTTLTTILGGRLYNDVYKILSEQGSEFTTKKNIGVTTLKKSLVESANKIKEKILESAHKIENIADLEKIAIVSVEDEKLGKVIAQMVWETGIDGFIDVVEGYKGEIETEIIKGMRFPAKVPAKTFVNNPARYEMVIKDSPILITNYALENPADFAKAFQEINNQTATLTVVAPSFSNNAMVQMVTAAKGGFFIYPVSAPSLRTEQFEDLAVYCGATFIDKNKGKILRNVKFADLGFVEKLVVKDTEAKEDAVATGGRGTLDLLNTKDGQEPVVLSPVKDRIEMLKKQITETPQENFKKLLERRVASMASAVGIIRVGDSTQASALYRKLKIEDAVYACKAALRGGYVKGAGLCLKEIATTLPENDIIIGALLEPNKRIVDSGVTEIGDEVIDPAEVIYYAVEHAVGVVSNLVTVDIITNEIEDPIPGDAETNIARAILEMVILEKKKAGLLKENEDERMRDEMGGLTTPEILALDNG